MALLYQIALTSVWWNDDYQDVRRFNSALEQQNYFNLASLFEKAPLINFDIKDLMRPRIVFKEPNRDVFDVLNSNYLIVKDNHASSVQKYFYYFIDRIYQDSGDQYIAECKLDVWQTFHLKADFGSGLVERVHLPRFKYDSETEKAEINFDKDSPLLITEHSPESYDKILKVQNVATFNPINEDPNITKWLEENVLCWVYIFIDISEARTFESYLSGADVDYVPFNSSYGEGFSGDGIDERFSIMAFPVYKKNSLIRVNLAYDLNKKRNMALSGLGFKYFLDKNNGYTKIYNAVVSNMCPLFFKGHNEITVNINGNTLDIDDNSTGGVPWDGPYDVGNDSRVLFYPTGFYNGLVGIPYPDELKGILNYEKNSDNFYNLDNMIFDKSEIVNQTRKIKFEPKFRQSAYTVFSFDFMHIIEKEYNFITNPEKFNIVYCPSPVYNETKIFPAESRYFKESPDDDFSIISFQDLSIPIINTQLEQYIANNKSWARIGSVNSDSDYDRYAEVNFFSRLVSTFGLKSALNPGGFVGKMIDSANALDLEEHKPEDLKAAPSIIKNSTASVLRIVSQGQAQAFYKVKQVPEAVLKRDLDYYYYFGYRYGYYKKFTDILNSSGRRKYFNYISGAFNAISGDINDTARRELRDLIAKGVRIWEVDKPGFDDSLENYEKFFDEEEA